MEERVIMSKAWEGFKLGAWSDEINVSNFIQENYQEYKGDESFLSGPSHTSLELNEQFKQLLVLEKEKGGVIDLDTKVASTIT